jgi:protein-histidine pros-kinase
MGRIARVIDAVEQARTALVVDDDPDVSDVCALILNTAGFTVVQTSTGTQALALIADRLPSVVILDYVLPDLDGIEVLRRLRSDPAAALVPVVMVTARSHERDRLLAWDAGATDFLVKPFQGAALVAAVERALIAAQDPRRPRPTTDHIHRSHLAAIVASTQDAVIGKSLDGTITSWNEGAVALYGWHEEEAVGSSISMLAAPGHESEMEEILAQIRAGQALASFETVRLHRDGRRIHVSLTVSPVHDESGLVVGASTIARDVTERVREEIRFRGLVEAAPDAMVVVDEDGLIELVNRQVEILFGYPRAELQGRPVEVLVPGRFRGRHPERRRQYAARPTPRGMGTGLDLFGLKADGTEFPIEISLSPLHSDLGISYAATIRDGTERRRAEARFRGLLEAAPDAIVGVDDHARIVLVNQQAEGVFGFDRSELVGQSVELLVPGAAAQFASGPDDSDAIRRRSLDMVGRRRDGSEFPAEISLSTLDTDTGSIVSASIRDATERKRAEERFRGLVESAPDAMVIVATDGSITLVNAQTEKMFGYDRSEMVGQSVDLLVPLRYRGAHPGFRGAYTDNPRVRAMGAGLELYALRKDGTEFPVEISLSPLASDEGVTISAAIRDVTDRRRAEEALALAFAREKEAAQRLREVDRLRNDFLSTVSHELRTPLTAIKGFSEWLSESWETTAEVRRREILERIRHAGNRLDFLIQDLLDFSRVERGNLKLDVRAHRLIDIVSDTIAHLASALESHTVEVDVDEAALVEADQSALERVLENLLTNAAKFAPPGSQIEISSLSGGEYVVLAVRDHGPGIPESEHDKIFDRFYRVADTAAAHPGTGIGLAIVKQFVEAQGGRIELVSAPGSGSEFRVHLRRAAPSGERADAES